MFKIGEFSKLTQVSIRMLRYYDETGLLKPAKTDKFTNYRLYAMDQIPVSSDTFTIYHDMDYREKDVDMEICAPVARMGENINRFVYRNTEPVPIMACTMVYGSFENIAGAFLSFANWLQEHNQYKMAGTSRQIVHRGPWNEDSPDKYLTEIQVPLVKI